MPAAGAGPSRRSHTKSRKGCKTCKKRHIRCDETFPQCRNCTKHQCRCDYMDAPATADESTGQSPVPGIVWSPEIEQMIEGWARTGEASLGPFTIDLRAQGHEYTRADLHLIYFMLAHGQAPETREFTVWTSTTEQTLIAARSKPFLVHAILAFSALSLAWESNSIEMKTIAYRHGGIALEGLQQAIASFSRENSDAILLASVLLSWQANDWRSWVSLTSGIRTVVNSMQPFKHESPIRHVVDEQESSIPESFPSMSRAPPDEEFHNNYVMSLQQMMSALEGLEPYNVDRKEAKWFSQLKEYLQQLQNARPADTPQEQFNHLYHFRKFIFWIPSSALKSESRDYSTLLSLSYLYAIALQMEPLFPNVAAAFCSRMVLQPLEEIFQAFDNLQQTCMPGDEQVQDMVMLLQYPRQIVSTYRTARRMRDAAVQSMRRTPPNFDNFSGDLASSIEAQHGGGILQRSPAFGPDLMRSSSVHSIGSSHNDSPYLELPDTMQGQHLHRLSLDLSPGSQYDFRHGSAPLHTDIRYDSVPLQANNRYDSVPMEAHDRYSSVPVQSHDRYESVPVQSHDRYDSVPLQSHDRYDSVPLQSQDRYGSAPQQQDQCYGSVGPTSGILHLSLPAMPSLEVQEPTPIDPRMPQPFGVQGLGLSVGGNDLGMDSALMAASNRHSMDAISMGVPPTAFSHTRAGSEGALSSFSSQQQQQQQQWPQMPHFPSDAPEARQRDARDGFLY